MVDDPSVPDPVVELQSLFRYQNNSTGEVSNATLTAQQICRLLCPPDIKVQLQHISRDTNLLQQLPDGSYAAWRTAWKIPVLRESCAVWYKFSKDTGVSQTPMTCRQMIERDPLLLETMDSSSTVQYSSDCTNSEWKTLQQLPDLRKALEALCIPPKTSDDVAAGPDPTATGKSSIQQELEAFLSSTSEVYGTAVPPEEETYESDGGTCYVKDAVSGRWIHEKLAKANHQNANLQKTKATKKDPLVLQSNEPKKRKRKGRFSARKGRCWIYVTGLPLDCTETELAERFQRAGILELDPETQKPKLKLYRHKNTTNEAMEPALRETPRYALHAQNLSI
jgi:hypothetical protein